MKIGVLQTWQIFTRTRKIAMFYLATINLGTFQQIYVTKVTFMDNFTF